MTKEAAAAAVDATLESIVDALKGGDSVRLVGFGNFEVAERKASNGRNPRTGEPLKIPASRVPKFKAGKAFKEAVNG
ncbi:MAG: HU family DNA-binding protein [Pseudomonadota bacterium]